MREGKPEDYVFNKEIYHKHYKGRGLYPQWQKVINMIEGDNVLEIGCGTGQFAHMVVDRGLKYNGFDFSEKAIQICNDLKKKHNLNAEFYLADAKDKSHFGDYDCYVCISTLEHISADKEVISNIPSGKQFIFILPFNSNSTFHLRIYASEKDIHNRYSELIEIREIIRFKKGFITNSIKL